jgi:hypothetical protein
MQLFTNLQSVPRSSGEPKVRPYVWVFLSTAAMTSFVMGGGALYFQGEKIMAKKQAQESFFGVDQARPGNFRFRRVMTHCGNAVPAPLPATSFPATFVINAGELGGIGNALNQARALFPRPQGDLPPYHPW